MAGENRRLGRRRRRSESINRLIPNALTVMAMAAGLSAIQFGLSGQYPLAAAAILVAAVLDALDGRVARLMDMASDFGAQLDSLSDFVSFGVAPAVVLFTWTLADASELAWVAVLFYAICCGLRLARFNTSLAEEKPAWALNYFQGVPAPAGAATALLPMMGSFTLGAGMELASAWLVGAWLVAVGLLMVSTIPTYSAKTVRVPHRFIVPALVAVGLLAAFLVIAPWLTLTAGVIAYLAAMPFAVRAYRRLERRAREHGDAELTREAEAALADGETPAAPTSSTAAGESSDVPPR